jgi:hypothetical protein
MMTVKMSADDRLKVMATRLHSLLKALPENDAITDTLDYVIGALYGLKRAKSLGFSDRPGVRHETYGAYLTKYVLDIAYGNQVHSLWLGGFYFNSAIQRLAASYDRIPGLLGAGEGKARERMISVSGSEGKDWYSVYKEVNALKHDPKGMAKGRRVTLEMALNAVDELLDLVEAKSSDLSARYRGGEHFVERGGGGGPSTQ